MSQVPKYGHEVFKPINWCEKVTEEQYKSMVEAVELWTWLVDNESLSKRDFEGSFDVEEYMSCCPLCEVSSDDCIGCLMLHHWPDQERDQETHELCLDEGSAYCTWEDEDIPRAERLDQGKRILEALKKRLLEVSCG